MRPMVYEYPDDPAAQAADLQYFLGPDLLVAPLYRSGGSRPVWFPPGEWVHYRNGGVAEGGFHRVSLPLDLAPLWLRAGSSLLLTGPRRRLGDGSYDDLTVAIITATSSALREARLEVASYGEATIAVEPTSDNGADIRVPPGLPKLGVAVVGGQPMAGHFRINGRAVAPSARSALMPQISPGTHVGLEGRGGTWYP